MAEGVEFLLKRYPDYVAVDDLPLDNVQERVSWFIWSIRTSQCESCIKSKTKCDKKIKAN